MNIVYYRIIGVITLSIMFFVSLFDLNIDINKQSGDVLLWWTSPITGQRKWTVIIENYI